MQSSNFEHASERWRYLVLSCISLWCFAYCYDIPAAIHDHLAEYSGLSAGDFPWFFNALYAGYSFPNLILPLLFGYYADSPSSLPFVIGFLSFSACLGQFLLYGGVYYHIHWLAIVGRVTFGIGCESLGAAVCSVLFHAFQGHEVAFALAVSVSIGRIGMSFLLSEQCSLGTIANDWISPVMSSEFGVTSPFALGCGLAVLAVISSLFLVNGIKDMTRNQTPIRTSIGSLFVATKELRLKFWITGIVCGLGYAAILPFTSVFVANKPSGLSQAAASQIVSVVFLICVIVSPLIACGIDRFGGASHVLCFSCLLLCVSHSMFLVFDQISAVAIIGLAYAAFVASIWPMIPLTVDDFHVGLGYGLATSMQNAGLVVVPLITASIKEHSGSYAGSHIVFLIAAAIALAGSLWVAYEPKQLKGLSDKMDDETLPLTAALVN